MKKLQKLYGMAAALVIVLGIVGCNLLDNDVERPTSPTSSFREERPTEAGQIANFYVGAGMTDFYGVYIGKNAFTVNIPKSGMFLLTYYTKAGFRLTSQSLENLRIAGLPEDILAGLTRLEGQDFTTEEAFFTAITLQIGNEQMVKYKALILNYAYTKTGGPFFIVVKVKKNSLLHIGLMPWDEVLHATIDEGDATTLATTTPDAQDFGSLIVLFRPGFIGSWMDYFVVNFSFTQIILVRDGVIMISVNVQELSATGTKAATKPKTKPKTIK